MNNAACTDDRRRFQRHRRATSAPACRAARAARGAGCWNARGDARTSAAGRLETPRRVAPGRRGRGDQTRQTTGLQPPGRKAENRARLGEGLRRPLGPSTRSHQGARRAPSARTNHIADTLQAPERTNMKTETGGRPSVESFEFGKEIEIAAPIEIAFEAVLDQLGPEGQMPGGKPFPMTIEQWHGGRWYRDCR